MARNTGVQMPSMTTVVFSTVRLRLTPHVCSSHNKTSRLKLACVGTVDAARCVIAVYMACCVVTVDTA